MRRIPLLATVLIGLALGAFSRTPPASGQDDGWTDLFNGKDLTGWKVFLKPRPNDKEGDLDKVFTVKDGTIHCRGDVFGYLRSEKEYGDYVLKLQWRWGEKVYSKAGNRNSGVFVHVIGDDKIWPKGVEAQLAAGRAGDIWLVDNFMLTVDRNRQDPKVSRHFFHLKDDVEKPVGQWNQYEIACQGDKVRLFVNGVLENEGSEAEVTKGNLLLQSEGAEISFKDIKLKSLAK